jgi:hypothetical protein
MRLSVPVRLGRSAPEGRPAAATASVVRLTPVRAAEGCAKRYVEDHERLQSTPGGSSYCLTVALDLASRPPRSLLLRPWYRIKSLYHDLLVGYTTRFAPGEGLQ